MSSTEPTFLPFSRNDGTETINLALVEGIDWYANGGACLFANDFSMEIDRFDADRLREGYPEYLPPHKPVQDATPEPESAESAESDRRYYSGLFTGFAIGILFAMSVYAALGAWNRYHDPERVSYHVRAEDVEHVVTVDNVCGSGDLMHYPGVAGPRR